MTQPAPSLEPLVTCLGELLEHATTIWNRYLRSGPGRLEAELFDEVAGPARRLPLLLRDPAANDAIRTHGLDGGEIEETAGRATEWARRCVCTPQGLCFVSGEAGLIPRRDQHQEFEATLQRLGEIVRQLRHAA